MVEWLVGKKPSLRVHQMRAPDHTVCNLTGEFIKEEPEGKLPACKLCVRLITQGLA